MATGYLIRKHSGWEIMADNYMINAAKVKHMSRAQRIRCKDVNQRLEQPTSI